MFKENIYVIILREMLFILISLSYNIRDETIDDKLILPQKSLRKNLPLKERKFY